MASLAILASPRATHAQAFSENFESYAPNSNIHGQGGWTGWAGNPAAGATVSTAQSLSPTRSLRVSGANHPVRAVSGVTSGVWTFKAHQFIPTTSSGTTKVAAANRYRPPYLTTDLELSAAMEFNLTAGAVSSAMGGGGTLPLVKGSWVEVRAEIDLNADWVRLFYNGEFLAEHSWTRGTGDVAIAAIELESGGPGGGVYYDDLTLEGFSGCCPPCTPPYPHSVTVAVEPGINYLANPLCHGTDNTLGTLLPTVPDGSSLWLWDAQANSVGEQFEYYDGLGWVDRMSLPADSVLLEPGVGFVLLNPGAPYAITFQGCDPVCAKPCGPDARWQLLGVTGTNSGDWDNLFSCPPVCGTVLRVWNQPQQAFQDYTYLNTGWVPSAPQWEPGAAVLVSVRPNSGCCIPPPAGMVAWWPGDNNANDIQGGNNGILVGGATFSPSGKVGPAFLLDGINDYVRVPSSPSLNPAGSFTIDAWIYVTADGTFPIVTKWGDSGPWSGQRAYALHTTPGRGLNFAISDDANQWNNPFHTFHTPGGEVPLNTWTLVAGVYDQATGTRSIYVDGVQAATRTDPPITITASIADLTIGNWLRAPFDEGYFFPGMIDEVEIFNRALSQAEIQAIFNAGSAGKCKPGCQTPLVLTCASNKSVECGSAWSFDPPTATQPDCTNVTITVLTTVTNAAAPCAVQYTRTWQASDCCSNVTTCGQTVTVVDTTPPEICCPADIVRYTCTNAVQVFYDAQARDNCVGATTVTYNPPSGSWFAAGTTTLVTATATDACGNTNQCTFRVIVRDQVVQQVFLSGVDDCYRRGWFWWWRNPEPVSGPSACLLSAYPTATWKRFDDATINRFLGNSWQGLPSGIVEAYLYTQMRPPVQGCDGISGNDTISLGLATCSPPSWLWSRHLGSGNASPGLVDAEWCNGNGCQYPFSFNLAALPVPGSPPVNLLPHMNTTKRLDLLVQDDTTVDFARLRIRHCLPGPVVGGLNTSLTNAIFGRRCWWWWIAPDPGMPAATPFSAGLSVGGAGGITIGTPVSALPAGAEISFVLKPTGGIGADTNAFGTVLGKAIKENGVQYSAEVPSGVGAVELVLSFQGQVVHAGTVAVPPGAARVALLEILDVEDPLGATLTLLKRREGGPRPSRPPTATLHLAEPRVVEGAFGQQLVDTVSFSSIFTFAEDGEYVDLVVGGVNVPEIELTDIRLEVAGDAVAYGGNAMASANQDQLVLSPFDPLEGDPVWFSVTCAPTNELRVFMSEAIPTEGETFGTNATLTLTTRGVAGGVERDLPPLRYRFNGARWRLDALQDDMPVPLRRVELWNGGTLVAEATDVSDLQLASPAPVAWPTVIWFVDADICHRNNWPKPIVAWLNGAPHEVTEVRVQTDTYGLPVTAITGQHVQATALGALVFAGTETGAPTYWLEAPEISPDGVTVRWGGIGGVLERAPTVNGPWTLVPGPNAGEVTLPLEGAARFLRVRGL